MSDVDDMKRNIKTRVACLPGGGLPIQAACWLLDSAEAHCDRFF